MDLNHQRGIIREMVHFDSKLLKRMVKVEYFMPASIKNISVLDLLLINDGQDLEELGLEVILEKLITDNKITPLLCVGIHAGDRIMEYGTAEELDYLGRGYNAGLYTQFIFGELLPLIKSIFNISSFHKKSFAGFSLGGLSALDIVWNHPLEFTKVGVFSGSLWWRSRNINDGYVEDTDRIMHAHIRNGNYAPGLKFFFQAGTLDETMDRNNNGVIDSIDDTLGVIDELVRKGYDPENDISYLQLEDGKHDIKTWSIAMPSFLQWGWGKNEV